MQLAVQAFRRDSCPYGEEALICPAAAPLSEQHSPAVWILDPGRNLLITLASMAVLASAGFSWQPQILGVHGEWAVHREEDPMVDWIYSLTSEGVPPLKSMASPHQDASMSVRFECGDRHMAIVIVRNAPRIGPLQCWPRPRSTVLPYGVREQDVLDRRGLVRVRWDKKPPTWIETFHADSGVLLLFRDPLAGGDLDRDALLDFFSDLSEHSTLLVEIPWADSQLRRSHFRVSLDGAGEAIEDTMRRCPDLQER